MQRRKLFGLLGGAVAVAPLVSLSVAESPVAEAIVVPPPYDTTLVQQYADLYRSGLISWKEYCECAGVDADDNITVSLHEYGAWVNMSDLMTHATASTSMLSAQMALSYVPSSS